VEDAVVAAARAGESPFLALDRDAGGVGHLLVAAGQAVEQGGLAAVGHADEREPELARQRRRTHGVRPAPRLTMTAAASRRLKANRLRPSRTAIGSAPGQIAATTSRRSPGMKPSSSSRWARVERTSSP